jgi:hypothetical protein
LLPVFREAKKNCLVTFTTRWNIRW